MLSDFQVTIPELGTMAAVRRPYVVLTSNATRELSEAVKRRCLYLHLGYPSAERERAIVTAQVPELDERIAEQLVASTSSRTPTWSFAATACCTCGTTSGAEIRDRLIPTARRPGHVDARARHTGPD